MRKSEDCPSCGQGCLTCFKTGLQFGREEAAIEHAETLKKLQDAVNAHIKITAAMRCGGRTPEKALDTMLEIRQELGL